MDNVRQYLVCSFWNWVLTSFKIGILGSSLTIVQVKYLPNEYLTVFPLILVILTAISYKLGIYLTRKVKKLVTTAYTLAYLSDLLCIVSTVMLLIWDYKFVALTYLCSSLSVLMYQPINNIHSYLRLKVFGGLRHLSIFQNRYDYRKSFWASIVSGTGMVINLIIFQATDDITAIRITCWIFVCLFTIDSFINFIEARIVKKLITQHT